MLSGRLALLSAAGVLLLAWSPAAGQSVISTHSGVVHFFEGAVYIGDQPLEHQFGRFPEIPEGAELRTGQGRAEILLTPDAMLRIAEHTVIRMVSNDLSNTRVELVRGTGILESGEAHGDNSLTLIYKTWQVRFPRPGVYRLDSEPPHLLVNRGEAEVSAGGAGSSVSVKTSEALPFADVLAPDRYEGAPFDAFSDWAADRSRAVSMDNAIAGQIVDNPNVADNSGMPVWGYTYFPSLGTSMTSTGLLSPYGYSSWSPYSLYFPGYFGYRGVYSGWPGVGRYTPYPGIGAPYRRPGGVGLTTPAPRTPPPVHVPPPRPVVPARAGHH